MCRRTTFRCVDGQVGGRLGKKLGPHDLMPSQSWHHHPDLAKTIHARGERRVVSGKVDKTALLHIPLLANSHSSDDALMSNITSVVDAVVRARPSGAKGTYVRALAISFHHVANGVRRRVMLVSYATLWA